MSRLTHSFLALSLAGWLLTSVGADDRGRPADPSVEVKADWNDLPGVDGKTHSLKDIKTRFVAVAFLANQCALCQFQEEELNRITEEYRDKGVTVVGISVSTRPEDRLSKVIERTGTAPLKFPYLHDASQEIGRTLRVSCTPTVLLLDEERKVIYRGALNDDGTPIKKHYLREALEDSLAGRPVAVPKTRAIGCGIRYD